MSPEASALVHIRRAIAQDAEALSALALRAKAHWGYAQAQLDTWRSVLEVSPESVSAHPTFLGELDGQMVGFYSLVPSASAWELDHLWVAPEQIEARLWSCARLARVADSARGRCQITAR